MFISFVYNIQNYFFSQFILNIDLKWLHNFTS